MRKVTGEGAKVRFVPTQALLEDVINDYLSTRCSRAAYGSLTPLSSLLRRQHGTRLRSGGRRCLVRQSYRWAGIVGRVPKGVLVHAIRHTMITRIAEDGASARKIERVLGDESLNASHVYIEATANEQRGLCGQTAPTVSSGR